MSIVGNYNSPYTGKEVDDSISKFALALTQENIKQGLGNSTTDTISQKLFSDSYEFGVKNFSVMPPPSVILQYVVGLYTGETTSTFIQSHYYKCVETATQGVFEWQDITTGSNAVVSVNGKIGAVVINAGDVGAATQTALNTEITNRQNADTLITHNLNQEVVDRTNADTVLQNNIDNLQSIRILNKGVITTTTANIQTTCTQYVVDNYGRQPQHLDGLVVTITDSSPPNDKVQYMWTDYSNTWIDVGMASTDIADASTTEKGIVQVGSGINVTGGIISTDKTTIGLGNVDNTSDLTKPVSTATQAALGTKLSVDDILAGANITLMKNDNKVMISASGGGAYLPVYSNGSVVYDGVSSTSIISATGSPFSADRKLSVLIGANSGTNGNYSTLLGANNTVGFEGVSIGYNIKGAEYGIMCGKRLRDFTNSPTGGSIVIGSDIDVTGNFNIILGLYGCINGANNTFIVGGGMGKNSWGGNNRTVISGGAFTGRANTNCVYLGNEEVTGLLCQVTSITALSDSRVKEDVKLANTSICLMDVNRLPVSRYKYKNFTGTHLDIHRTGFMADDVEKVFPKAVQYADAEFTELDEAGKKIIVPELDEDGNQIYEISESEEKIPKTKVKTFVMDSVKNITMEMAIPTLWGAVQELSKKIIELENKLK